jgi:DNA repair exonuclease SbcCD ATPase subunit
MGRVVRARSRLNMLREEAADAPTSLEVLQTRLSRLTESKRRLEQAIGELGKKIAGLPLEEIAEREKSRQKLDQKIQQKNQDLGGVRAKLYGLTSEKQRLDQELEKSARKNKSAQRLLTRRNLLLRSGEFLSGLLQQYETDARKTIQDQINEILRAVAHREYECRLNPNFSIELTFSNGLPTPKSGGENQLLSLVFIASLVKFAALRINDEKLILKPGTVAPLVLDAPFGQLDTSYQRDVAANIPRLAEQVVLLVTSSQGNERVLEALEPHIGAEYVLISENRGPRGSKNETRLPIHGKDYICSLFNQPRTMTRIERIL